MKTRCATGGLPLSREKVDKKNAGLPVEYKADGILMTGRSQTTEIFNFAT